MIPLDSMLISITKGDNCHLPDVSNVESLSTHLPGDLPSTQTWEMHLEPTKCFVFLCFKLNLQFAVLHIQAFQNRFL